MHVQYIYLCRKSLDNSIRTVRRAGCDATRDMCAAIAIAMDVQ